MNTFEWNNRAVQHLRRGNSADAVVILLKTVFRLRKARARAGLATANMTSSNSSSGRSTSTPQPPQDQQQQEQEQQSSFTRRDSRGSTSSRSSNDSEGDSEDKFIANVPISTWPKNSCEGDRSRTHPPPPVNHMMRDPRAGHRRRPVENVFLLFDHAFVTSTQPLDAVAAQNRPLTYAIVLYNTGLALHMKGMEDDQIKQTQSQSLHLALKFYSMALEVLEESQCQDGSSSEILLLLLALYNNIGHIQCHFFNVEEAQRCVEWLRSLVNAKSVLLLPHLREEHSFFCLSVLIPPGSEFSLAPAA